MSAMRSSVENQINSFRLENKNCELYGSFYNLQLDHNDEKKSAFDKLVLNFINENINIKVPNKFGVMDDDIHRNCFLQQRFILKDKWCDYHLRNASLRILCKKCNAGRPKTKRNILFKLQFVHFEVHFKKLFFLK